MSRFVHFMKCVPLAAFITVSGCSGGSGSSSLVPISPINNGKIIFVGNSGQFVGIEAMNMDGTGRVRLLRDAAATSPSSSFDGRRVVFASQRSGNGELYIMDANGSSLKRVTSTPETETYPSFSPNGRQIVFVSGSAGREAIYIVNRDGAGKRLVYGPQPGISHPRWSPDGRRLVFSSTQNGNGEIYTIGIDGTRLLRVTSSATYENAPAWSPDGGHIAFARSGGLNRSDIYVARSDGSSPAKVAEQAMEPCWSRDGRSLIFTSIAKVSGRDVNTEIHSVNPDGSGRKALTNDAGGESSPTWAAGGLYESDGL